MVRSPCWICELMQEPVGRSQDVWRVHQGVPPDVGMSSMSMSSSHSDRGGGALSAQRWRQCGPMLGTGGGDVGADQGTPSAAAPPA